MKHAHARCAREPYSQQEHSRMTFTQSGFTHAFLLSLMTLAAVIAAAASVRADSATSTVSNPASGSEIVCIVYSDLNGMGTPIPVLSTSDCMDQGGHQSECSDGLDNDSDGLIDTEDPSCYTGGDSTDASSYDPELDDEAADTSVPLPQCMDTADNDADGLVDRDDPGCHTDADAANLASYVPGDSAEGDPVPPEDTRALCADGVDNDADGLTDLSDPGCATFAPALVVTVAIDNSHGGTATTSDVQVFLDGVSLAPGVSTTTLPGAHAVSATTTATSSAYAVTYGGDCGTDGSVSLALGDSKTCTVTFTDSAQPQCADGIDNDDDSLVDSDDPGCHTDGNASNQSSYDASLDDESATHSSGGGGGGGGGGSTNTGGGGGGGNGPIVGLLGGGGGGPVTYGAVLGIATSSAPTSCDTYLTAFIRAGQQNDPEQVRRLQTVLQQYERAPIMVNGTYDAPTVAATRAFQGRYASEILAPWRLTEPTGYVYLTTRKKVNEIYCNGTKQFPLTTEQTAVIARAVSLAGEPAPAVRTTSSVVKSTVSARAVSNTSTVAEDTDRASSETPVSPVPDPVVQPAVAATPVASKGFVERMRDLVTRIFAR